jgi:hypothetical protein
MLQNLRRVCTCGTKLNTELDNLYCDMLPGNPSVICGFWDLYLGLLVKSSGGIYH